MLPVFLRVHNLVYSLGTTTAERKQERTSSRSSGNLIAVSVFNGCISRFDEITSGRCRARISVSLLFFVVSREIKSITCLFSRALSTVIFVYRRPDQHDVTRIGPRHRSTVATWSQQSVSDQLYMRLLLHRIIGLFKKQSLMAFN